MLEMLREHQIGPRFRALMIGAQKAKGAPIALIAVPFWGKGAIKILGLGRRENVRIICNLNSTACNPHVIENLKKLEGCKDPFARSSSCQNLRWPEVRNCRLVECIYEWAHRGRRCGFGLDRSQYRHGQSAGPTRTQAVRQTLEQQGIYPS
jgi:hypothetical protein